MTQDGFDMDGYTQLQLYVEPKKTQYEITFNMSGNITFSKDLSAKMMRIGGFLFSGQNLGVIIFTKDGTDSKGNKKGKVILFRIVSLGSMEEGLEKFMDGGKRKIDEQPLELKTNKQNKRLQLNAKYFHKSIGFPVLGKKWGNNAIKVRGNEFIVDLTKRATSTKRKSKPST